MRLWVDDERPMPESWGTEPWMVWSKTSADAIDWLETFKRRNTDLAREPAFMIDEVSLDHDLGDDDTGFKVLDWMIENEVWPDVLTIHTSNRPARERMLAAANAEAPEWVEIFVIYDHLRTEG